MSAKPGRLLRSLAMAGALSAVLLAVPRLARAQDDECTTDAECVELYAEGFVCVSGSLGRYCVERGCLSDAECRDEYGSDSWCEDSGPEAHCVVPDPPHYAPPFRSLCGAVPGAPGAGGGLAGLVALGALALAGRGTRVSARERRPRPDAPGRRPARAPA